ncbi:MAG: valine--pyruvate transaminase [Proteobacteria bacterium]|nr:valine--pyruvate transaminase [Pseudomonadota bacterium]HJP06194.1 valine--pyruvate transaminase [Arenicellales bacterium]
MQFSRFGEFLNSGSGILTLMEDIDQALCGSTQMHLLGGGNPARIPQVQKVFREAMTALMAQDDRFERLAGDYDGPQGDTRFIHNLAHLLNTHCGWNVTPANIVVTNGSQSSFFALFHLFAGDWASGDARRILLPLAPEYIGYADVGLGQQLFRAFRPAITLHGDREFKYHVDFDRLTVTPDIGAIAVSRPTNPTGNVLTDSEVAHLRQLAVENDIPLILDSAYGGPFPNIVFPEVTTFWDENTITCLSLSKLGLPGLRTGIIVAKEKVAKAIAAANAILSLAPGSVGPALITDMISDASILSLSNDVIRPYYRERAKQAVSWIEAAVGDYPCRIHTPEGAIFLWLWFEGLPITSEELYQRLKQRGVLVIAGEHFFPGLGETWDHRQECIRISYAQDPASVETGIGIIGEEIARAFDGANSKCA